MFGLGFGEVILIGLIALLVIGPDQLPGVARSIAKLLNELKRSTDELKKEFENENISEALQELKQLRAENLLRSLEEEKAKALDTVSGSIDKEIAEITNLDASPATQDPQPQVEPTVETPKQLENDTSKDSLNND